MYSDQDGTASKLSQAEYDTRRATLLWITTILSCIGFGVALVNGEYSVEAFSMPFALQRESILVWSTALWPMLSMHSLAIHWYRDPVDTYIAGLRGSLMSLVIVCCKLLITAPNGRVGFSSSPVSVQLYVAVLVAIVQILLPRRPHLFTPEGRLVDAERSSSAFYRYTMQWCVDALIIAGKPDTKLDEFPVLDFSTRSRSQQLLVLEDPRVSLWTRILNERFFGFAKQWMLMFARSAVTFGSPYCIMRMLKTLESGNGHTHDTHRWLFGLGAFSVCHTIINYHLIWIQWSEMGIPVRAQLIMSIFQKTLRRKDSKCHKEGSKGVPDKPGVLSLISSDTLSFSKFTAVNYIIPASFARFLFAMTFLFNLLGWQSTLTGLVVTATCIPIHTYLIREQQILQRRVVAARDRKTNAAKEALNSLPQIKFSATESQWEDYIDKFRREEIQVLRRTFVASIAKSVWSVTAPFTVAASCIYTYSHIKGAITPSIIFPLIEVLPHLQGSLGFVPVVFMDYFKAKTNAGRMDEFLRGPEQEQVLSSSPSGTVSFHEASFAWPSDVVKDLPTLEKRTFSSSQRFSLYGVNLNFPIGEFSIISGRTGSGKSLLLSAILGEVDLIDGRIKAPSVAENHPVAFVSQSPWLQSTSIKENILFGSLFDSERYNKVLEACALGRDLSVLSKGDETQIGLRGVKLSGGQRARLALGRALYSRASTMVLDDIFSSLDAHVCKAILNALTGELGKGRTRILATHQVSLCLPKAKYVVHIKDNTISYHGPTDSIDSALDSLEPEISNETIISGDLEPERENSTKVIHRTTPMSKNVEKGNSRTDLKVYKGYFVAAGGIVFTLIYVLGLVTHQLLAALTAWLLGNINSARSEKPTSAQGTAVLTAESRDDTQPQHYFFHLYILVSMFAIGSEVLFSLHAFSGSIRASETLFRQVTSKILRMPLLWLDTTPLGEMLRAVTIDIKQVDEAILTHISDFANSMVSLCVVIGVGLYSSAYTAILTVLLLCWCAQASRRYIKARSLVRRADAIPTADILEQSSSSSVGLSTIRAFGVVDASIEQMHRNIDRLSTARRHFWIFNRWLGLQMSFVGILFSTGTGIILLFSESIIDPSLLGFSISFSLGFSKAIFSAVNNFGILETCMDSADTIIRYSENKTEDQGGAEVSDDWPSEGEVRVESLNVAYANNLPLVLRDVSFTVGGGKRLGIAGRTGAGKSSLALSLLRLLEPQSGSIFIDGVDIATIKLQTLRSRIAFIPQDPVLFSGTVRSNLDYFKQVSDDKLEDALRAVKLASEAGDKKAGFYSLDSSISAGGANMSQGQRQLLCLARVFIKNPKIIILDEATSAVDDKTDLFIQNTIRKVFNGTLIVVAHRLRTIAPFDQVMVMNDCKVAEIGSPAELFKAKGLFYDLVQDSQDRDFLTSTL
ncbi:ABC multidrug transporter [Cadophora sp. MPI-SDFR-AT-0126]|nr:ABC multidrug transporter [Leotiomycetes sp. MPI-SDFR-AT-0126]